MLVHIIAYNPPSMPNQFDTTSPAQNNSIMYLIKLVVHCLGLFTYSQMLTLFNIYEHTAVVPECTKPLLITDQVGDIVIVVGCDNR